MVTHPTAPPEPAPLEDAIRTAPPKQRQIRTTPPPDTVDDPVGWTELGGLPLTPTAAPIQVNSDGVAISGLDNLQISPAAGTQLERALGALVSVTQSLERRIDKLEVDIARITYANSAPQSPELVTRLETQLAKVRASQEDLAGELARQVIVLRDEIAHVRGAQPPLPPEDLRVANVAKRILGMSDHYRAFGTHQSLLAETSSIDNTSPITDLGPVGHSEQSDEANAINDDDIADDGIVIDLVAMEDSALSQSAVNLNDSKAPSSAGALHPDVN